MENCAVKLMFCRRTNRVQIRNVPTQASKDDIEELVESYGQVLRCDVGKQNEFRCQPMPLNSDVRARIAIYTSARCFIGLYCLYIMFAFTLNRRG